MKNKQFLLMLISIITISMLVACVNNNKKGISDDESMEETSEEDVDNEEETGVEFNYDTVKENSLNRIAFDNVDSFATEYLHIDDDSHEAFHYMRMSGTVNDTIIHNDKYYFTNANMLNIHDKNSLEMLGQFGDDTFKARGAHHTDKYSVFHTMMVEEPFITIFDRDTQDLKHISIDTNDEIGLNSHYTFKDDLMLTGVHKEDSEGQERFDLYAINLETGKKEFVLENSHEHIFDKNNVKIDNNQLYAFDVYNNLYAFNRHTFEEIWRIEDNRIQFVISEIAQDDNYLYVSSDSSEVFRIDKSDGQYEQVFFDEGYIIGGVKAFKYDLLIVQGETPQLLGLIDLNQGQVIKEIEFTSSTIKEVEFRDGYYMLLIDEDDNSFIAEIPFNTAPNVTLIDIELNGGYAGLSMHVVNDMLHVGANRHFYLFK